MAYLHPLKRNLPSETVLYSLGNPRRLLTMWTPDIESALFRGVCKFKPSGIHKHWQMINVNLFMNEVLNPSPVTIDQCWAKLGELYDLAGVEAIEDESREEAEREFRLSWDEFGDLMLEHALNPEPSEDEDEVKEPVTPSEEEEEDDGEGEDGAGEEDEDEDEESQRALMDSRASSVDPDEDKRSRRQRRGTTPDDEPKGRRQSGRLARARSAPKSEQKSESKNEQKKRRATSAASTPKRKQPAAKKEEAPAAKRRKRK